MANTVDESKRYSEPVYAKNPANVKLPWWNDNIDKYLEPGVSELLLKYSNIPKEQQSEHVHKIRQKAWDVRSYPICGSGIFMIPTLTMSPAYQEVLGIVRAGGTFFDIGSLVGVDMRQLVFDGAPSDKMTGVDIAPDLWEIGYEMYQDRDTFKGRSFQGDLLSLSQDETFKDLKGNCDVIELAAVLHQWGWDTQVAALKQLVPFSKIGTVLVGYQVGNIKAHDWTLPQTQSTVYKQDPESFSKMVDQVEQETSTTWKLEVGLKTWDDIGWDKNDHTWLSKDDRILWFVVRRTA